MSFSGNAETWHRQGISVSALAMCCALPLSEPSAGSWRISPSVGVSTTVSDNINAATDREDRNSDIVGTLSPGVTVTGTGGRVSLNLAFTHEQIKTLYDASEASSVNTLIANGQAEIYDRVAFVDLNASITRQVVDSQAAVSSVDIGSDQNRTTVRSISFQPFFLHHFGTYLETQSRYRFDATETETDEIANTRSSGESFSFNSGRRFSVFTFSGSLDRDKTIREGGAPRTIQTTATSNYRLRVNRRFSLLSSVGWENIDDPTLTEETRGFTWNVGFSAQPNSRSSIELTYGREFNTDDISLDANYALSSRTSITASYGETLTTSEQLLSDDLSFVIDDGTGTQIDSRTGLVFDPVNANFDFQNTLFRQRVFTLGFSTARRRSSYQGSFSWEERDDEATNIVAQVYSLSLTASRTLSSRLSVSASGDVTFSDPGTDDNREDKDFRFSASLTYRLRENTNASLSYVTSHTKSNLGENNFHDNVVSLSLTQQF